MKKNTLLTILILLVLGVIAFAVIGKSKGWIGGVKPIEVDFSDVNRGKIIELVTASGAIQPEVEVNISPEVPGEIIKLTIMEGDSVSEGDLLVQIRPDNYINALERARATYNQQLANYSSSKSNLARSEAQYLKSELEYNRQKKLYEQKVISDSDYEVAQTNYKISVQDLESSKQNVKASQYVVKSASASVDDAEENLRKTSILAPMTGTVSKLSVELGERVVGTSQMAGTELLRVANLNKMEVKVDVNENDIVRVSLGDDVVIDVDSYTNLEIKFKGIVTEIASTANPKVSADAVTEFEVKIRILNESFLDLQEDGIVNPFKPGMTASVEIITQVKEDILIVPISSVTTKNEKDSLGKEIIQQIIYVNADNKAKIKEIKTGISDFENIEILSGLSEGDEIISGPYIAISKQLKDNAKIIEKEKPKKDRDGSKKESSDEEKSGVSVEVEVN